jgi:hypothetical protein
MQFIIYLQNYIYETAEDSGVDKLLSQVSITPRSCVELDEVIACSRGIPPLLRVYTTRQLHSGFVSDGLLLVLEAGEGLVCY